MTYSKLKTYVFLLCLLLLLSFKTALPIYAADNHGAAVVSIDQQFDTDDLSVQGDFSYQLTPLEVGIPMPEGTANDVYRFQISGTKETVSPPILFDKAGVYQYQLEQIVEKELVGYTYDQRVLKLEIYVSNTRDGNMETIIIVKDESGNKLDKITFMNSYTVSKWPSIEKPDPETDKIVKPRPQTGSNKPTNSVKTGDSSNIVLWSGILIISSFMMVLFVIKQKKQRRYVDY